MSSGSFKDAVRLYLLWHPDCLDGSPLAPAVYLWFRGDPGDLTEAGFGIPVHYRFSPGDGPGSTPRKNEVNAPASR